MNRDKRNVSNRSPKLSGRDRRSRERPADDESGSACAGSAVRSNNDRIMAREQRTHAGKSPDVTVRDSTPLLGPSPRGHTVRCGLSMKSPACLPL
jgi:hypothetical protein